MNDLFNKTFLQGLKYSDSKPKGMVWLSGNEEEGRTNDNIPGEPLCVLGDVTG